MAASREEVIELLITAYRMELETIMNYLANGINLDGVRAEEIKKSLVADVTAELGHAQQLANRIKQIGGQVPGSLKLKDRMDQDAMQPSQDTTDVLYVIRGVIAAEESAIAQYKKIIRATDGDDYVTQDICIQLLTDEEEHLVQFNGYLKEYAKE